MSTKKLLDEYCLLVEGAKKSKKSTRKLDPKAKVRNRPSPAFPAESPKVKGNEDHFPMKDADQARSAWSRAHQTGGKAPAWYKGTYKEFLNTLKRKIHQKFPGIELAEDKKKSKKADLDLNLVKDAALKESIDQHLDRMERYALAFAKTVKALKSQYFIKFDPELEQNIVDLHPEIEKDLVSAERSLQNVYHVVNSFLDRTSEAIAE